MWVCRMASWAGIAHILKLFGIDLVFHVILIVEIDVLAPNNEQQQVADWRNWKWLH